MPQHLAEELLPVGPPPQAYSTAFLWCTCGQADVELHFQPSSFPVAPCFGAWQEGSWVGM